MEVKTKLFFTELSTLLKKYKADISADDEWTGYAECGQDIQMRVEMENNGDSIELGSYLDSDKIDNLIKD